MIIKTLTCDRCGRPYDRNHRYSFEGPRSNGRVTGFTLLANRRWLINYQDLCDDCLNQLVDWAYPDKMVETLNVVDTEEI